MFVTGSAGVAAGAPLRWLAAGDSYSSGEGLPHSTGPCAQAHPGSGSRTWALAAYEALGTYQDRFEQPLLVACTAAQSWRFFGPDGSLPAEWSSQMGRFDLITFTFGGDDLGFADIITQCIHLKLPGVVKYPSDPGHHCPQDSLLRQSVSSFAPVFAQRVTAIANQAVTTGGRILVLGYPELIESPNLWAASKRDAGGCGHLNVADAYEIRGLAGLLNATIGQDVAQINAQHPNGVHLAFVDVNSGGNAGIGRDDGSLFEPSRGARHNLCSTDPWINPVSGIDRGNGSYHPKQAGLDAEGTLTAEALVRLHWTLSAPVSCRTGAETLRTRGFSCADAYRRAQRALHVWEQLSSRANRPVTAFTSGGVQWRQSYKRLPGCCEAQIFRLHGVQGTRLIDYEQFQSQ